MTTRDRFFPPDPSSLFCFFSCFFSLFFFLSLTWNTPVRAGSSERAGPSAEEGSVETPVWSLKGGGNFEKEATKTEVRESVEKEKAGGGGKESPGAMTHRGKKRADVSWSKALFQQSDEPLSSSFLSFRALERDRGVPARPCDLRQSKSSVALRNKKRKRFLVCVASKKKRNRKKKQLFVILPSIGSAAPSSRGSLSGCIGWVEPPDVRLLRAAGGCCDECLFSLAAVSAASAKISSLSAPAAAASAAAGSSSAAAAAPCDGDGERDAARVRRPRRGGTVNVPSPLLDGGDGRSEEKETGRARWKAERETREREEMKTWCAESPNNSSFFHTRSLSSPRLSLSLPLSFTSTVSICTTRPLSLSFFFYRRERQSE